MDGVCTMMLSGGVVWVLELGVVVWSPTEISTCTSNEHIHPIPQSNIPTSKRTDP